MFLTFFSDVYFPISNSLKSIGALFLAVYLCEQQLTLKKRPSRQYMQQEAAAHPSNTTTVLSPLFEKKKLSSRNIMSTEIEVKEREFENEQEQINNINRAKTKLPNQNRVTNNIPSTINDDED
jgi:hypothetical protein